MKTKILHTIIVFFFSISLFSQSIEILSFNENPLEVNPLFGSDLTINYKYTSESGATSNHIYIGLEILDANKNYKATVAETTLRNQPVGNNTQNSVSFFIGSINKLSKDLPDSNFYQVKAILYKSGGWQEIAVANHLNTPFLTLQDTSGFQFSKNYISKGADVSWMTEMESEGFVWKDVYGNTKELMPLLKEYQLDAIRLRVWVNPENSGANGWCDIDDLVQKATLANALNLDIMVCIHYSDWWADPGKQNKPNAWSNFTVSQLETAIENHTTNILTALDAKGITPKWVQVGNETNDGMLWETGKASTGGFANYAKFINAGLKAVKTFDKNIKTMLHLANGNDNALFQWNIDGLINNNLAADKLDIIGMSLYPDENNWISKVDETYANMLAVKSRYNKEVMMVEVGFNVNEPEIAHKNWKSYNKGAWNEDGTPSRIMNAFVDKNTLNIDAVSFDTEKNFKIYPNPSNDSILIKSNKQVVEKITISDVNGKTVKQINTNKNSVKIDISVLKKGIYLIKINDFKTIKFLKN